jgi:hypothetical protein
LRNRGIFFYYLHEKKIDMTRLVLSVFVMIAFFATSVLGQADKSKRPSPPKLTEGAIDGVGIKVDYSAPSAKGRKMIGGIEKYGDVWRTGANEATVFVIDKAAKIEGQTLAAGKYELFSIPGESEWTIIFQKFGAKGQWGAYDYNQKNDALRVKVKAGKPSEFVETFTFVIENGHVVFKWENVQVGFSVTKG